MFTRPIRIGLGHKGHFRLSCIVKKKRLCDAGPQKSLLLPPPTSKFPLMCSLHRRCITAESEGSKLGLISFAESLTGDSILTINS